MIFYSRNQVKIKTQFGLYHFFVSKVVPPITATTEDDSTRQIIQSCKYWLDLKGGMEKLAFAMHYYRQALRLFRVEPSPQTMIPETILNLSKALEIILHDASNRESFKKRAIEAGFDQEFITEKLIPILLLRSKFGSAHVMSAPLTLDQKDRILQFLLGAFNNVQYAINEVWKRVVAGQFDLEPVSKELDKERSELLDRIDQYLKTPNKPIL